MQKSLARDPYQALSDWVRDRGVQVLVISPHLDDGAFSAAESLRTLPVEAHVYTVFTTADEATDQTWALRTGFADAHAEFAARRLEDVAAMGLMKVPYSHAGLAYGQKDDVAGETVVSKVADLIGGVPTLVLLPLGAGDVIAGAARLLRRLQRRPFGSPAHPDHLWVRDILRDRLDSDLVQVGYYAEIPYHWANSRAQLNARAAPLFAGDFCTAVQPVDADYKHQLARAYVSQLEPILGENPEYQRKLCAADEIIYLPL